MREENPLMSTSVRTAVIPAAGLGTRFLPATKAMPKEMLTVVDRPSIQWVVEEAVAAGIDDIVIITSPHKKAVEDHFDRMAELEAALESKGSADARRRASHHRSGDIPLHSAGRATRPRSCRRHGRPPCAR